MVGSKSTIGQQGAAGSWYNGFMVASISRSGPICPAIWLVICAGLLASAPIKAQAQRVSQTRINEYAATLMRAHRVLIEDPGLRKPGEQLSPYMHRIAAALPRESDSAYLSRVESYITNLERCLDRRSLCTTVPALTAADSQNAAEWRKAVAESAELPARLEHLRAACAAVRAGANRRPASDRMAVELDRMLIAIKTAFEYFRNVRP